MGSDKSTLVVDGLPLGERTAQELARTSTRVTVLGQSPLPGHAFLADEGSFRGPLCALSRFVPHEPMVFVCSCDMPLFDARIVPVLESHICRHDSVSALVPVVDGETQPLCALYRAPAFLMIQTVLAEGRKSMRAWLDTLWVEEIDEAVLVAEGLKPHSYHNANTPEALSRLLKLI